jgi:single-strand DNA-binding protein
MRSVNKVILIGNLTRDPDLRETPNGQAVCTFGLATNREWVTRDTNKHSLAEYHELVAWANLAEVCGKYLRKGKLIYIEGYLKTRSWDTPEGIRRHKTEIVIQDMIMLEKRPKGEEIDYVPDEDYSAPPSDELSNNAPRQSERAPERAPVTKQEGSPIDDDAIEF